MGVWEDLVPFLIKFFSETNFMCYHIIILSWCHHINGFAINWVENDKTEGILSSTLASTAYRPIQLSHVYVILSLAGCVLISIPQKRLLMSWLMS